MFMKVRYHGNVIVSLTKVVGRFKASKCYTAG